MRLSPCIGWGNFLGVLFLQRAEAADGEHVLTLLDRERGPHEVFAVQVLNAGGQASPFARALGVKRKVEHRLPAAARFAETSTGDRGMQTLLEADAEGCWFAAYREERALLYEQKARRRDTPFWRNRVAWRCRESGLSFAALSRADRYALCSLPRAVKSLGVSW